MIELTITPTNPGSVKITCTDDFRVTKYLQLTAEEKAMVRMWIARAEALTAERG